MALKNLPARMLRATGNKQGTSYGNYTAATQSSSRHNVNGDTSSACRCAVDSQLSREDKKLFLPDWKIWIVSKIMHN
jgi:hypothetical protein